MEKNQRQEDKAARAAMEGTRKKEEKAKVCEKNGEEDVRRERRSRECKKKGVTLSWAEPCC